MGFFANTQDDKIAVILNKVKNPEAKTGSFVASLLRMTTVNGNQSLHN